MKMEIKLFKSDIINVVSSEHYNEVDFIEDLVNESLDVDNQFYFLKTMKNNMFYKILKDFYLNNRHDIESRSFSDEDDFFTNCEMDLFKQINEIYGIDVEKIKLAYTNASGHVNFESHFVHNLKKY